MSDNVSANSGDLVSIQTTGGGGWGDPLEREPSLVCYDIKCGLVSDKAAFEDYGVVVRKEQGTIVVDDAQTS